MAKKSGKSRSSALVAMFLAWIVPGAGHVYAGRVRRGIIIFVVVGATFWTGVAIGGVMTVDYQNERWWFAAEMLTGVHGLIGWRRQRKVYRELAGRIGSPPPAGTPGRARWDVLVDKELAARKLSLVTPTDTFARAYAGVAGLLNLMCVFDAVMLSLLGVAGAKPSGNKAPDRRDKQG